MEKPKKSDKTQVQFNFESVKSEMIKHMETSLEVYREKIKKLRVGRASVAMVEDIKVNYYNNLTPLKQVATITTQDASTILISPWDKGVVKDIEKAIISSGLGFGVAVDSNSIRLTVPPLTEERKKEILKVLHKEEEEAKVAIRNIRHKHLNEVREAKKSAHISEDLEKRYEQEIEKITHEFIGKIEKTTKDKEKEIMEV